MEKMENDVLFGYWNGPSCGEYDVDDGGFSVEICSDGRLIYKTYIFSETERTRKEYQLSAESVRSIRRVLSKYENEIAAFENHIDNGSDDGEMNIFVFKEKKIVILNSEYKDEEAYRLQDERYLPAARQENEVLRIFDRLCRILKDEGIRLNLNGFFVNRVRRGLNRFGVKESKEILNADQIVERVVSFLSELPNGTEISSSQAIDRIYNLEHLQSGNYRVRGKIIRFEEFFEIDRKIRQEAERNGLILDTSKTDSLCLGLPFNIPFVIRKAEE